jgi:hypothetical protein
MLRASSISLRSAVNHNANRRRHQFVPSIGGAASTLEDRALLSGMGGTASHALAHHPLSQSSNPPNSSVGPIIANSAMFTLHHRHARPTHGVVFLHNPKGYMPLISSVMPPVVQPLSNQQPPPNSSVGPIIANSSGSANPPNSSVGPIIANSAMSQSSNPPNSSVGPIIA